MLWKVNLGSLDSTVVELNMKDIRTVRCNVKYDTATLIRWSPDSKALLTVRALGNNIEIYKVNKKPQAGALPSVQPSHAFAKVNNRYSFNLLYSLDYPFLLRLAKLIFWLLRCPARDVLS